MLNLARKVSYEHQTNWVVPFFPIPIVSGKKFFGSPFKKEALRQLHRLLIHSMPIATVTGIIFQRGGPLGSFALIFVQTPNIIFC